MNPFPSLGNAPLRRESAVYKQQTQMRDPFQQGIVQQQAQVRDAQLNANTDDIANLTMQNHAFATAKFNSNPY